MADFDIKKNDSAPALRCILQDDSANPIDLTNASTVQFHMKSDTDTGGTGTPLKVDAPASVIDAVNGIVEYAWLSDGSDTDTPGVWFGEFEVSWSAGGRTTFPNYTYISISIIEDLDED